MKFDAATVSRLRAVLKPRRERYDFAFVMNKWAELVTPDAHPSKQSDTPFKWLTEDGADLVAELLTRKPRRKKRQARPSIGGRRRVDQERYAALLLGFIFQEFTGNRPSRTWDAIKEREVSPFYHFAHTAFQAIGLNPSTEAFRDVCGAWESPTDIIGFDRPAIEKLLWGGLAQHG